MNSFMPIKFIKLAEKWRVPKMTQEDIETLKSPINIKEIESGFKNKHTHTNAPLLTWIRQFSRLNQIMKEVLH